MEFNKKYPHCDASDRYTMIELWNEYIRGGPDNHVAIGDGICDKVPGYNVEECGYDGGE